MLDLARDFERLSKNNAMTNALAVAGKLLPSGLMA